MVDIIRSECETVALLQIKSDTSSTQPDFFGGGPTRILSIGREMAALKHPQGRGRGSTSVSQKVENFIRQSVYRGHLHPRERIIEEDVARRLNVSRGTVREALLRLERDGLVVTTPRHGTYIRAISGHELRAIFGMRGKLEGLCVRYMREAGKPGTEATLRKTLRKMKAAAAKNDSERFFHADMELHHAIWKLSGQSQLFRTLNLVMSPFIFLIARTYSSVLSIRDRFESHRNYVDLILETPLSRVEREVERYFDELYKKSYRPLFPPLDRSDGDFWLRGGFQGQDSLYY